ncbi:MAG: c-type cytochrome [Acidobacteriota bacterium]
MNYRHISLPAATLTAVLLAALPARGQDAAAGQRGGGGDRGGGPPAAAVAPQNLQVLPKETTQPQVLQAMQQFTAALGVQCSHCHVQAAAAPGGRGDAGGGRGRGGAAPAFDFASDDKPQKKTARQMMLMVREINPKVVAATGRAETAAARVGCVTCHRGVAIPRTLAELLDQTTTEKGTPAAIAQYRDLRRQYFGAQAYDFSEATLVTYAQRATTADKADDAIAWLQLNLDFFPQSSRTYIGLSQAQQKKNDKDGAIKSLEKAVELDPLNAVVKRQLDQLKGLPAAPPQGRGQ